MLRRNGPPAYLLTNNHACQLNYFKWILIFKIKICNVNTIYIQFQCKTLRFVTIRRQLRDNTNHLLYIAYDTKQYSINTINSIEILYSYLLILKTPYTTTSNGNINNRALGHYTREMIWYVKHITNFFTTPNTTSSPIHSQVT